MQYTPDGFQVAAFMAECPDCKYRFPVKLVLDDMMVAVRCRNCTNTDVQIEFTQNPMPLELYETWMPGILSRVEKFRLRKIAKRLDPVLDYAVAKE